MEFRTFPVASTNIFPQSNSKSGGQLVTEFNLRSREMVATDDRYEYEIGPSFLHSTSDFYVDKQVAKVDLTKKGKDLPSTTLTISPGRAVINGHFVQTHTEMKVDMLDANLRAKTYGQEALYGELAIGIRAVYSTEATMAGALLVEAKEDVEYVTDEGGQQRALSYEGMYEGIQIIISKAGNMKSYSELHTSDELNYFASQKDSEIVHIKLATFTFIDGNISDIVNIGEDNLKYISATRILDEGSAFSSTHVTRPNGGSNRLYAYTGRYSDDGNGKLTDIWCDATDSLMVWDATDESRLVSKKPKQSRAQFVASDNQVKLIVPHQQPHVSDTTTGTRKYYTPVELQLPNASYSAGTPGVVTPEYTNRIKAISRRLDNILDYKLNGKLVTYIETRRIVKDVPDPLPTIIDSWEFGDYILVRHDETVGAVYTSYGYVSTMYTLVYKVTSVKTNYYRTVSISDKISGKDVVYHRYVDIEEDKNWPDPGSEWPSNYVIPESILQILSNKCMLLLTYRSGENQRTYAYSVLSIEKVKVWSDPILVTAQVPLAQEGIVGGFYSVSNTELDKGYVWLDEEGHLRLLDYSKLASGTLAYQLGDHVTISSGLTIQAIQEELDDYVNNRVAFPTDVLAGVESEYNVIDVVLNLSELTEADGESGVINIFNIDSRFNTSVCLHIKGTADSRTTINIYDCEKIRIASDIEGTPVINVYRSCLYYDPAVFNYIRTNGRKADNESVIDTSSFLGMYQITLWYEAYEDTDAQLHVDGMTVITNSSQIIPNEIDFWNSTNPNDKHVHTALHSVTFSESGDIIRCGLLIQDNNTNQLDGQRKVLIGDFSLPNNPDTLEYPVSCLTKSIKVTGSFVTSHQNSDAIWTISNMNFTAVTGKWDGSEAHEMSTGSLSIHSVSNYMAIENVDSEHSSINKYDPNGQYIPGWDVTSYHLFEGGAIG